MKLGYKLTLTNRSLFSKLKQNTTVENLYDAVYNIPCLGDGRRAMCDLNYVGNTGHRVKFRKHQHVDDIKTFNLTNDLNNTTALVHHYYEAECYKF